jgi:hypothetical protein
MKSTENKYKPIDEILLEDHKEMRLVWQKYLDTSIQEDKMKWYRQLVYLVAKHSIAKEVVLIPLIREKISNGNILADNDLNQTRKIKQMFVDMKDINISQPNFDSRLRACWNELDQHMMKIEKEDLKKISVEIPLNDRIDSGRKFENRKMLAPSRIHVNVPDESPTLDTLVGLLMSPIDKFKDLFSKFPEQHDLTNVQTQKEIPISGTKTTTSTIERNI